ncbi:MAG: hypothetical protein ACMV1D_03675, partial [Macromonas sp.]
MERRDRPAHVKPVKTTSILVSVKHSLVRIAGHLSDNREIDHGSDNKIGGLENGHEDRDRHGADRLR